ncbi:MULTISPECIES: phage major capsid protein [Levilactobacillus]|jgi:HK97 family phage major capsid protein|uniref:Phage major capsid protein n=1 Tax=Levilactobacillus namurensis TaxID=380393 RepID=A0AAW8WA03_9LACO|nr:phage major capsid protein [Levilactobacillus namurensis]MDT7015290.1 phage major capsid protein [Levilactobacillus namurensis]
MNLSEIKDAMTDSQEKLTAINAKITEGLLDDKFSPENMAALKSDRDNEQARFAELKTQRETAESDQVASHIAGNSAKTKKGAKKVPVTENKLSAEKHALNDFLHSKGAIKDTAALQVTSTEAEPLVPEEIIYNPQSEVNTVVDLKQLVNVVPVTTPSGSYPILKRATDTFPSIEELKENPALAEPDFQDVDWKVSTRRGAIPLSQEAIDDSQVDLTGLVGKNMGEKSVNTTNADIAKVLQGFTAVASTDTNIVDTIKGILNVSLDPAYAPTIVATQSLYNTLDTLKDNNGQYIFHQDITTPSTGVLAGVRVVRISDTLLGKAGDQLAFIGDLNRAILFADRQEVSLSWADDKVYGQYLMGALRYDVKVADADAGYFLTNTAVKSSSAATAPTADAK